MMTREQQVRNSVTYLLPTVIGSALPLLTLPVYTRVLSREDYGAWALCLAYATFLTGLANFGLTIGYERSFHEHPGRAERAKLLYSTLAFVTAAFGLCAVVTWVFRASLSILITGSASHAALLFGTMCAHAVMSLKAYFLITFRNTGLARAHVWYSIDELVAAAVMGVLFVVVLDSGVIGIPIAQLIASAVVLSALTRRFVSEMPIALSGVLLKEELAVSYPLTPRILLGVAGNQIDKYLLGLLGTLGGVGVYAAGQRLAQIVFALMTALENVFTPQVYERMFKLGADGGAAVGKYLTPFAYMSALGALGLGLFAEEAITILTPPPFHGAIPIAGILCLHYGIMFFGKLPQLVYARKTGLISVLTLVSLSTNALLNVVFIRQWGAVGAAAGTLSAGILSVALVLVLGQKHYPIRWEYGALTGIFGVLFAGVILSVWMREAGFAYMPRLGVKLLMLAIYGAVGAGLGIVSRENVMMARSALGARFHLGSVRP
jgi:O-antigen/teichoic acid export membrane protein